MATPKNDELRTDLVTNSIDPLAAARFNPNSAKREAAGRSAFSSLIGSGGYDSLPEAGKQAFRAFGLLDQVANAAMSADEGDGDPALEEKWNAARQAALDAVRDARAIGIFNEGAKAPAAPDPIVTSKDPTVRNQAPTGTTGETSGTQTTVTVTTTVPNEPNTTTPAVKGSSKP